MLRQSLYATGTVESVASPFSEPPNHSWKLKELLSEEARFRED